MHWFDGSIAEAVAQSKSLNAVFIVFIEGPDDVSRELSSTLESPAVSSRLEDKSRFLSVKFSSTSPNYMHFAQIYKFVPVPSVFFIGRDGAPLEVVLPGITPEKLQERIDNILKEHYKTAAPPPAGPSTSSQDLIRSESQPAKPVPTDAGTKREAAQEMRDEEKKNEEKNNEEGPPPKQRRSSTEYEVVCDGDVCVRRPVQETVTSQEPSTEQMVTEAGPPEQPSLDSRLERAKEILEAKKREKEAKEKELEKQKEIERRTMGQGVAELKKWQADQDLKEAAEERRRERIENNLARQRILEQIAQDRAERRARDMPAVVTPSAVNNETTQPPRPESNQVRIQLKLPDGGSHVATFRPEDSIGAVHEYVATQGLVPAGTPYTLWTAFPRRELPRGTETLLSLGLAPSAALLVLPESGAAAPQSVLPAPVVGIYALIIGLLTSFVLQPAQAAWAWLRERLFPRTPGGAPPARAPSPPSQQPGQQAGLRYRPGSNIHRLREEQSPDDDNNTWNGNSTQQM